ncbi:hypothetical protein [Micromonospora aurantiaca (nom. illeg.)]|uniref:hypothetical protein n=1 Tax=Micromonospora aurantiaca (nom. illeg.) TaxID=47850 RepID=UPI0011A24A42|nr:hypothetical protein [Micromonospora aurantiaca]MBC9005159.1 hypothetical protein [Micromonospora aurantiaca]
MTAIVGLVHRGAVHIGGDSAGVGPGWSSSVRADAKVFRNGPYLMGFTDSFRMGQLLRYALTPPKLPTAPAALDRHMATTFIDAVRKTLVDGGWLTLDSGRELGGTFLVGTAGRLFQVYGDFQVGEPADGYAAVGCGQDIALGALHATVGQPPARRVKAALEAAAHFSAGVRGPFIHLHQRPPKETP